MILQQENPDRISKKPFLPIDLLLAIALISELLTPLLIWKGVLPGSIRWTSDAVIAILVALAFARMLVLDRIPAAFWVILASAAIGITVARLNGQAALPTIWGVWLMFEFPLVGILAYLQPTWPDRIPQRLRTICVTVLTIEVLVQFGQLILGEPIGDNLAGTFGKNGTGTLVDFTLLVLCLVIGEWIATRRWKNLVLVMFLGLVSSVLGEIKFFLPASLFLLALGVILFTLRNGQVWKLVPYGIFIGIIVLAFVVGYDTFVPGASKRPIESFVLDAGTLDSYMNAEEESVNSKGYMVMGRSRAVGYGWETITRDPYTLIFGMGLGARGESETLGTAGVAFSGDNKVYTRQSSLLVLMQEMGLLGFILIGAFILWIAISLLNGIKRAPQSPETELRYGLFLFSVSWPILLFYALIWNQEFVMLIYWTSLGFVMGAANRKQTDVRY